MGKMTPLHKMGVSDKMKMAWNIKCEILHHFLLSVHFWDKKAEGMEHEGRERRGNMLEDNIHVDSSLLSSRLCLNFCVLEVFCSFQVSPRICS